MRAIRRRGHDGDRDRGVDGISRAIAERFAGGDASVVVRSREQGNVDPVTDGIEESGGEALAVGCDVANRKAVEALVETTVGEFNSVDTLVNNTGASIMAGFDDIPENG